MLDKYREAIQATIKGSPYLIKKGKGMYYTQPKRNAYKIKQNGQYGGLMIDLPKLFGQLRLVASKNGKKVLDQPADFDTIDLLTKRFNSKKNYSNLSRMLFVMVMNLYSAFSINIFKCALQARDLWVRSDISIYRPRWQPLSVH